MAQLAQEFDLTDGRHVEPILKLADLDLLDGDLASRSDLLACERQSSSVSVEALRQQNEASRLTSIDRSVGSLTNLGFLRVGLSKERRSLASGAAEGWDGCERTLDDRTLALAAWSAMVRATSESEARA